MTEPDPPRSTDWSRRRALRTLAPLPLLALGSCGGSAGDASPAAQPTVSQHPSSPPAQSSPSAPVAPSPLGSPEPEVSQAPAVADAVALTFHGDGTPELAAALLGEAERAGARVTVLAVGQWLAKYPTMAELVLSGGHELGNHTEHHLAIDQMSESDAFAEIEMCAQRLEKLTGSRGRWFRQSQAQHASATVRAAATRAGYGTLLSYDLDPLDYTDPGAGVVVGNVLGRIRGGDVVSLHLGHPGTVSALPRILEGLGRRGLRAVTASELFPTVPTAVSSAPGQNLSSLPS